MLRAVHDALSHKVVDSYHQTQVIEAILLTDGLFQTASSWDSHMHRCVVLQSALQVIDKLCQSEHKYDCDCSL